MALKAVEKYIFETSQVIQSIKNHSKEIIQISKLIYKAQKTNKSIFVCGNGGSNSEAEHFVTELLCTYSNRKRKPISAISLNSSASSISAWSNDFQYDTFLKRSIQAHCKKDDILFILTTSGGSKSSKQSNNIVNAAKEANKKKMKVLQDFLLSHFVWMEFYSWNNMRVEIEPQNDAHSLAILSSSLW